MFWDSQDAALVYAYRIEGDQWGKVVVRPHFQEKFRDGGKRLKMKGNFVRTGGLVQSRDLQQSRYELIQGGLD